MQYKTPDVYVREKSILPPSVAEVATAIPVFVGYTEKTTNAADESITQQAIRITSMAEYNSVFGGPFAETFVVNGNGYLIQGVADSDNGKRLPDFILYQSVQHFFANGGGACYVISTGEYNVNTGVNADDFKSALNIISQVDEITLIVLTDAVGLDASLYYGLSDLALQQCNKLQDRFTIIDVLHQGNGMIDIATDVDAMRGSSMNSLKYGAAYYPYVKTLYPRHYNEEQVTVNYTLMTVVDGVETETVMSSSLMDLKASNTEVYFRVKAQLGKNYLVLPPSAAMAGIYSRIDGSRGVWKAPANTPVSQVLGPIVAISNDQQADLNVDTIAGKSVNAIRAFTGKGTLVWGARTLAGNDNEWRYVSVRRLFNMVEESVKKATYFAVFEPNTPFTWLKLKTMIESYLENLWKQGALFGESSAQAFFVNVGLGQTMTEDDINNGIMNIEIGLAAVRPAEFIVLTFSHKSLEA